MNENYLVSIIITCFNEESNIEKTFNAAISASSRFDIDCEFILVNDGSNDGTRGIIDKLVGDGQRVKALHHTVNLGIMETARSALAIARGRYSIFLPGDGAFGIEILSSCFERLQEADGVDCLLVYAANSRRFYRAPTLIFRNWASDIARIALFWTRPGTVVKRYRLICARTELLKLVPKNTKGYGHGTACVGTILLSGATIEWHGSDDFEEEVGRSKLTFPRIKHVIQAHGYLLKEKKRIRKEFRSLCEESSL